MKTALFTPPAANVSPIEELRQRSPFLFSGPDFWMVDNESIAAQASQVVIGHAEVIGRSAGGREIAAVTYGEYEPQGSTATISSANASDRPEAFYDPQKRSRPVLAMIGSIHGGETEGIALCANLISLMENGHDLRGQAHERLRDKLQRVRLVLVPNLNPDGREAAAVTHLSGAKLEDLFLVQQGLLEDGSLFRGRRVKEIQPIPPGYLRHRGGYYNADGVNLQHDDFMGTRLAPENQAIHGLFRRELPDAFMTLHAHGAPAAMLTPDAFLSPGCQRKQIEATGFILSRLIAQEIAVVPPSEIATPPWSFYFQTWLHHTTGALPLLFEFCHGLSMRPCRLEQTLDTGLILTEAWVDYCLYFNARPRHQEFFGPVVPAS